MLRTKPLVLAGIARVTREHFSILLTKPLCYELTSDTGRHRASDARALLYDTN
jgi:hypothetical protein